MITSPLPFARIDKRWARRSSGNISRLSPWAQTSFSQGLQPASPTAKQPNPQKEQRGPAQALLPTRGARDEGRARGGGAPWLGGFCLLRTFHFYRSHTAAILPHRSCQQWGVAFAPPAHFSSSSFGHVPVPPRSRGCVEVDRGPEGD